MRVCQFRHFGVVRLPNGAAKATPPIILQGPAEACKPAIVKHQGDCFGLANLSEPRREQENLGEKQRYNRKGTPT